MKSGTDSFRLTQTATTSNRALPQRVCPALLRTAKYAIGMQPLLMICLGLAVAAVWVVGILLALIRLASSEAQAPGTRVRSSEPAQHD